MDEQSWNEFEQELQALINRHSVDAHCETPDFLLAENVVSHLKATRDMVNRRESWHGRKTKQVTVNDLK